MRHGESTYNVERRVQGHCDESVLTEKGQIGARQVGSALKDLSFAAIYSSPLRRAKGTAELIRSSWIQNSHALPGIFLSDRLKEINLPLWEGLTFQAVEEKYAEDYLVWRDRPHQLQMSVETETGIQTVYPVPDLYEQARQFWQAVLPQHQDETILIVAHSGINRCLINTAIGLQPEQYQSFYQSNCGISILNFSGAWGESVQVESLNLTAHLGEPLPKPRKGHTGPRFLLVRHGETDWNRQKRFQGQIDVPLNAQGKSQSEQAGLFLKTVAIDRAVSSPMLRPKETAEIILQHQPQPVPLELNENLCEIRHGLWEGKLEAEIEQEFPGELQRWQQTPATVQMPEGENLQQVWQRAIAAWTQILETTPAEGKQPTTTLVVAHDAINKALLCDLVGQGPEFFWAFKQGNGAVTVIDYPQGITGQPVIQALNITTHQGTGVLDKTAAGAL